MSGMTPSPSSLRSLGVNQRISLISFNKKFVEAHLRMDNAAVMAMWAEDGVTLLPGMAPMASRKTIAKWLDDIVARMP